VPQNASITVIPNGVAVEEYENVREEPEPNTLIFTGSFRYRPNYDAMIWFLKTVFPLIKKRVPEVSLSITGDHGGLALPADPHVHLTGFVNDVRPLIARSWVSVAPLQDGGGTRLKILEAMAIGTPVVSTSKGAEGLDARGGEHLLIADTAEDFANCVVSVLEDHALRTQLGQNALQLIRKSYDWAVIMPLFLNVIEQAASPNRAQAAMMSKKAGRHEPLDKAP
jgi:glycosyltransferase involved in cell wall biosynthesis